MFSIFILFPVSGLKISYNVTGLFTSDFTLVIEIINSFVIL